MHIGHLNVSMLNVLRSRHVEETARTDLVQAKVFYQIVFKTVQTNSEFVKVFERVHAFTTTASGSLQDLTRALGEDL